MESPMKADDNWGYSQFRKPPYNYKPYIVFVGAQYLNLWSLLPFVTKIMPDS